MNGNRAYPDGSFFFKVLQRIIRLMLSKVTILSKSEFIPLYTIQVRSFIRGRFPHRYIFRYNQTSRVVAFVPRSMEKRLPVIQFVSGVNLHYL